MNSNNVYITSVGYGTGSSITIDGTGCFNTPAISYQAEVKRGLHPNLYFKYVKSKFSFLERVKLDHKLGVLEAAFYKAVEAGQIALGEKMLRELAVYTREQVMLVKGIKYFIERDVLFKHKRNIKGGHISDTLLKDYTRIIPDKVLKKKQAVQDVFDDFIIFHYYNEKALDLKSLSEEEKGKMRDPILFGLIRENNRFYFIDDWIDDYCDFTFDDIVSHLGKNKKDMKIKTDFFAKENE